MAISKVTKLELCRGCRNDFYNGNNDIGVKECWSLKSAKIVKRKFVHMNDMPPWRHKPVRTLSCHKKDHYVTIDPKATY